jgi:plasmid maintenance system antidote protein VapI
VNASEREDTVVKQREFPILSTMPTPRDADERTLRRCDSEQDAIAVAIVLSRVSQAEIARRMGIAKGYLTMLKKGERVLTSDMAAALCYATGCNLVRQYRTLQSAYRIAQGKARESDRIAAIASYSQVAA